MDTIFNTALEARKIVDNLARDLHLLPYNSDLARFCDNLSIMVTDLSKLEVYTRRTPPRSRYHVEYNKKRETIRAAIQQLENFILMHRLMA
jgi:hypothetical protein